MTDKEKETDIEIAKNVAREAAKVLVDKDTQYFDKMLEGAEKILRPWKLAICGMLVALILSNVIWAIVHFYAIYKAYQDSTYYEYQYEQEQNNESFQQNQSGGGKGAGN